MDGSSHALQTGFQKAPSFPNCPTMLHISQTEMLIGLLKIESETNSTVFFMQ